MKERFEIYDGSAEAKKAKGKSKNLSGFHPLFTASARRSIALDQLHSCDSNEFSFCFARIIFCSLKALVPLCIRAHMEICRIDDHSGCGKG